LPQELLNQAELETWGFALPDQVKFFQLFRKEIQNNCFTFTMDAITAADNIAAVMRGAVAPLGRNPTPHCGVPSKSAAWSGTDQIGSMARAPIKATVCERRRSCFSKSSGRCPPATSPAVAFVNASHKYSATFINSTSSPRGGFAAPPVPEAALPPPQSPVPSLRWNNWRCRRFLVLRN
jgi:hypothetical protein